MAGFQEKQIVDGMIAAALKAAHIALLRRKEGVQVGTKSDGSRITNGDYQSEQVILAELKKLSQTHGLNASYLMEENMRGVSQNAAASQQGYRWVVDPIDGTKGYSQGIGDDAHPWVISIALEKDGKTIASVVYEASTQEYGNSAADRNATTPEVPRGAIYWASANEPHAHKFEGEFQVRLDGGGKTAYAQAPIDPATPGSFNHLLTVPNLQVFLRNIIDTPLTAETQLTDGARPFLDGFYLDSSANNSVNLSPAKQAFCKALGLNETQYDDCYSAVSGAMRAADGRTNAYLAGRCYPWDTSASRLILEKSGVTFHEYKTPDTNGRTMLVAGRDKELIGRMMGTIERMRTAEGTPIATPAPRRGGFLAGAATFLGALGLSGLFGLGEPTTAPIVIPPASEAPTYPAPEVMQQLPGSVEDLTQLSDDKKILLAACTASGCDAVAYYERVDGNGFSPSQIIQMYPPAHYKQGGGKQPEFAQSIPGYDADSFNTPEAVLAHQTYHIPIYVTDREGNPTDQLKGIIVLHAPQERFSKLQGTITDDPNDLHEPVECRLAKLNMAKHIVAAHQDLIGATGKLLQEREGKHKTLEAKLAYFKQLITDSYATLGKGNNQQNHADSVAKLMDLAVDKTLGDRIIPEQKLLIHDLAELHDLGKLQMSSAFMRPWRQKRSADVEQYFAEQNHNHPLFTLLELLLYPTDAKMAAAHHHGVFRYSDEELQHALGEDFSKFSILKDNLTPEQISPLTYMLRVCDVAESMTGRGQKTVQEAVKELAEKVRLNTDGTPIIAPGTIHPDYLCFMIKNGAFDAYERTTDKTALLAEEQKVLQQFGWTGEAAAQKEAALREKLAHDPLLLENKATGLATSLSHADKATSRNRTNTSLAV